MRRTKRRGAAAVELALVLPLLVVVFAGLLDFARVYHASQVLTSTANAGATYSSGTAWAAGNTTDAAKAAAVAEGAKLGPPLRADQVTVTVAGGAATVTVEYDFPLLTGAIFSDGTVKLRRTAVVRVAPRPGD